MTLPFHPMNKEMVILISQGRYLSQQVGKDDISGEIFKLRILQKKRMIYKFISLHSVLNYRFKKERKERGPLDALLI